jgi:hypothetical protein
MKKLMLLILVLLMVGLGEAQTRRYARKPLVEFGPKANFYVGSVRLGLGAEFVVNPTRNVGIRIDFTEFSFGDGGTRFFFNLYPNDLSIDGLYYLRMQGIEPYVYGGFGIAANGGTDVAFRAGMGFNYTMTRNSSIFFEPGVIVYYNSVVDDTDLWFRLSLGAKFGLIR